MTKEITKAIILQEIQDKFKLREFDAKKFLFDETVVPIYDIGQHVRRTEVIYATVSITAGPTAYKFFNVPPTEKWFLHAYNIIFMTGVYTVAGLMVYRPSVAEYFYLDLTAAQSVSYAYNLPKDAILNPGDRIYVYVDGYTSTGDLHGRFDVTKEEVR